MNGKRAILIGYALLIPLLFCWLMEFAGTLGDGATSTSRYIPLWVGDGISIIQINLLLYAWLFAIKKSNQPRNLLSAIFKMMGMSLPFLITAIRIYQIGKRLKWLWTLSLLKTILEQNSA
jgi:hypothetical protein